MSNINLTDKYELNIISHHPKFKGQKFLSYHIDDIDTIGVWGDEPFEIVLRNHTYNPIQAKVSIDGTDVVTAKPATLDPTGKMWYVESHGGLTVQAWPETNKEGARFIFGKTENSVAAHTHGDLSNKGIIAVAIYTEQQQKYPSYYSNDLGMRSTFDRSILRSRSINTKGLELACADPGVGAGETIKQELQEVKGFRKPILQGIISLRYLWWDNLKEKIEKQTKFKHPTGFLEQEVVKLADLKSTPRIERTQSR
jgi:hypothetical protein